MYLHLHLFSHREVAGVDGLWHQKPRFESRLWWLGLGKVRNRADLNASKLWIFCCLDMIIKSVFKRFEEGDIASAPMKKRRTTDEELLRGVSLVAEPAHIKPILNQLHSDISTHNDIRNLPCSVEMQCSEHGAEGGTVTDVSVLLSHLTHNCNNSKVNNDR